MERSRALRAEPSGGTARTTGPHAHTRHRPARHSKKLKREGDLPDRGGLQGARPGSTGCKAQGPALGSWEV
eukprot:9292655-Pyramimonas_sp.AAC.1